MKIVLKYIYSYLLLPLFILIVGILSIFKAKYRRSFFQRLYILSHLQAYIQSHINKKKYIIIHCASMGEFEHIKPLITKLSESKSNAIIITFFSPSGYEHVNKFSGIDLILYLPFDFPGIWRKFYQILNPVFLIVSKHDAWPNQIWIAKECNIPVFLVNASLNEKSSRIKGLSRILFNEVYKAFNQIYAISESNKQHFENHFKNIQIQSIGDTKFDQVALRKKQSEKLILIPDNWLTNQMILIFGSVWPEDLIHLKESIRKILSNEKSVKLIIAPHQPDDNHINELKSFFDEDDITLFTHKSFSNKTRVLIVDSIGVLADLYKYAHIAYVGGSFKQGIHNVMEPAIYGIPVVYGPQHKNSYDAIHLLKKKGALQISNAKEALQTFYNLIENSDYRSQLGKNAQDFASDNTGVSDKLIKQWQKYLK